MRQLWRRYGVLLWGLVFAAILGGTPARAGVTEHSWEVGGYVLFSRYSNSSTLENSVAVPGVRGAYHFKANQGIEIDFDTLSTDGKDDNRGKDFDVTKVGISYIRNFQPKKNEKALPLLIFGAGRVGVDDGTKKSTSTFLRAGGGVRYFFTPRFALRADGRLYRWRGDNEAVPRSSFYSFDVTVGLSYLFGGGS